MFYSETLLTKTGPLARVWLSANVERKLTKNNVLQSDIGESVNTIVDSHQVPMSLRLTGQLLLGLVRIYSRKTRYLLDDCNEAILKLKMAFRSGNVDLPANQSHIANPASLTLPDVLTELDRLVPAADESLLLSQPGADLLLSRSDKGLLNWPSSQRLSSSMIESGRNAPEETTGLEDDLGLELDIGEDYDPTAPRRERDIEVGRDAPAARPFGDDFEDTIMGYAGDDLLDAGKAGLSPRNDTSLSLGLQNNLDDINFGGIDDDTTLRLPEEVAAGDLQTPRANERHSLFEPGEESVHVHQRAKKRKVLQADTDTEIHSSQIRAQQNDRSKILKPAAFLPRDPMLLKLMEMQRTGGFVSSILSDGRSKGWAPELRGILSLELIQQSTERKRKRDSGVDGLTTPTLAASRTATPGQPRSHHRDQDHDLPQLLLNDDDAPLPALEDDGPGPAFDDTTMPLLHPDEQGPVSLGTKHAVHLLRERFGGTTSTTTTTGPNAQPPSPTQRTKSSVLFQDLLPERSTSRAEATKMFFEVLVLATKDAVKVEQDAGALGGPLRVRAKRGLWGSWAEMGAGGEIEAQEAEAEEEARIHETAEAIARQAMGSEGFGPGVVGVVVAATA